MTGMPLTKATLLETMRAERARWEALLTGHDEAVLTVPGATAAWSVKDVVAHLMVYQRALLRGWTGTQPTEPPPPPGVDLADLEQRNAWWAAQQRARPLAAVLADWWQVTADLLARVEASSEAELAALVRVTPRFEIVPAAGGEGELVPLGELIAGTSGGHPRRHYPVVREWLEIRATRHGAV